ncbi:hypothetical protein OOU_Y34scaffold00204g1 [Pyricularia oryzae Y34]|uniref:Fucose-specific lectin n=2 Tax=Pyricularia oryzae TaxID=318829 RepID=A0AA97P5Q9_PYRO3|nr:hypothetical protein OOU_Y34scaffold00204g1 [Pyricularia oryzae Y34]
MAQPYTSSRPHQANMSSRPHAEAFPVAYSTLPEVAGNDAPQVYPSEAPQVYTNDAPQVYTNDAPQVYTNDAPETVPQNTKKDYSITYYQQNGTTSPYPPPSDTEPAPSHIFPAEENKKKKSSVVIKRRTCIILGIILAILVIGAIVGGVVGGMMVSRKNETTPGGTGAVGENNGGPNGASTGNGTNTNNGTNTGIAVPPPKNPNAIVMEKSGISAVSYTVDGTDYKMLFWQPQKTPGDIKYSAWDSKSQNWEVVDLGSRLKGSARIEATPGTAIATAVRSGNTGDGGFTLSVVYNGASGSVHELTTSNVKGDSWEKITYAIQSGPRAQLAARWDVCPSKCTNTLLVAYENVNKQIRIHYPRVTELNGQRYRDMADSITPGCGIALTALTFDNKTNEASSTKVYYQGATGLFTEVTRIADLTWWTPKPEIFRTAMPFDNPPQIYATSFEKPDMGLLFLAVLHRSKVYKSDPRCQSRFWHGGRFFVDGHENLMDVLTIFRFPKRTQSTLTELAKAMSCEISSKLREHQHQKSLDRLGDFTVEIARCSQQLPQYLTQQTTSFLQTWRVGGYGSSPEDVFRVTIHALLWDRSEPMVFLDGYFNAKAGWILLPAVYHAPTQGGWDRLRSGAQLDIPASDFISMIWANMIKKLELPADDTLLHNVAFVNITNPSLHRLCRVFSGLSDCSVGHVDRPTGSARDRCNPRQGMRIAGFEDFFSLEPVKTIVLSMIQHQSVFRDRMPVRVGWHCERMAADPDTAVVVRMGSYFRRFTDAPFAVLPVDSPGGRA